MKAPRVALFTDSYYEANGVARTASNLEAHAFKHERPMLVVHGGRTNQIIESGSIVRLELKRWGGTSVALEHDLQFDVSLWRHARRVRNILRWFRPDVVHVTGPSDIGLLGTYLAQRLGIPTVGSWHTNLHEYASRRLLHHLTLGSASARARVAQVVERHALTLTLLFYEFPRVILAPNREWAQVIGTRTGKQMFVMTRGVDTDLFSPARRTRRDSTLNVGYVGRLSAEKNVRALSKVDEALAHAGVDDVRFTIVGDGAEREWLRAHLRRATLTGVLRGPALSTAYADMDLFVFPSETETVGNVVLEAMASGVPVVAMARGGPRHIAGSSRGAVLAETPSEFVDRAVALSQNRECRQAMACAAREDALERSWSSVFETVYEAYRSAIALAENDADSAGGRLIAVVKGQPAA
jgi:glycosyltransferase involved in cell wall biosynthesis